MKSRIQTIIKIIVLLTIHCSLFTAFAQAPEKMSYQAVIRNTSNTLITNQAIGMRVSILQGSATGTEVYKELFNPNPQTNINGLVTVEIGSGVPLTGTFEAIDWANGPFFIKTETDPTGGTTYSIVGTSQLLSAPYALYAKTTGSPSWSLSGNAGTNPNVNFIGTTDNKDIVFKRDGIIAGKISTSNTALGIESLSLNTTGYSNTAIGNSTMRDNTTGQNNVAIGGGSLMTNLQGSFNTAVGNATLLFNYNGNNNSTIGHHALLLNTSGSNNATNGFETLKSNSTGSNNTANGYRALTSNTTGNENVATGYQALYSNTTGNYNTANGKDALRENNTGIGNTANGAFALQSNTTSHYNTAYGYNALFSNTTGGANTAAGLNALYSNTTGYDNTAIGNLALYNLTATDYNTALGRRALYGLTAGENNLGLGYNAQVPSNTGSNQVRIGNTSIIYAGTQVAWSVTSDRRWKENIQPSNLGLNFINDLTPVFYTRKNDDTKKVEYGIIAQELEVSLNKFGANTNGIITKDDEGMYSVRYNDLLAPMIKAIQEQQVMIEELKAEIQTLKNKK